jgi:hypothetical protein
MVTTPVSDPQKSTRSSRPAGPRVSRLDVIVFACVVLVGLARLPTPFDGDQALNLLMGRVIAQGGAPYLDLWDLKHVGVFVFFAAGGGLFGFDEIGIHLFELLWMLALALLVRATASGWLRDRLAIALAPAFTVGFYFAIAGERYLTQTEALVALPLLASAWCAAEALRSEGRQTMRWLAASGLWAGVVIVFKLPYVAIPAVIWLLALRALAARDGSERWSTAAANARWLIGGMALPVVATVVFFVQRGVGALAFWTYFGHPAEAWEAATFEPRRLARAARSFVLACAPVLFLAGLAIGDSLRLRRVEFMTAALCAWLGVGGLLISAQVISWWDYHFLLLLVPAGLLAARGIEVGREGLSALVTPRRLRLARAAGALTLVVIFSAQFASAARVVADFWRSRPLPFSRAGVDAYQDEHHPAHAAIRARTLFLREPGSHRGSIYVIDTPVYYLHAGRWPAAPLLAPWFHPTDRLWGHLLSTLQASWPPYVRVSDWALQAIVDNRPSMRDDVANVVTLIEEQYVVLSRDDDGAWYVRRDLATAAQ